MSLLSPQWRTSYWPSVLVALVSTGTSMANFFLPVYFKSGLGFSGSQIGLLYAVFSLTTMLAVVPVGLRNDRVSPRWLVGLSLLLVSAAGFGMARVHAFAAYLLVFLVYGLGQSGFRISIDTLIFKTATGKNPGGRWGYFNGFRMVGIALGTVAAGYILAAWGFPGALNLLAVLALTAVAIVPLLSPVKIGFPRLREYVQDLRGPGVLGFFLWLFLFSLHWGAELTCYGLFLREKLGLSMSGMGWYMCAEFVVLSLTCLWAGSRTDRGLDQRRLAMAGLVISGTGQVLMCIPVVWFSLLWRSIHGIGDGFIVIVTYMGIARLFDRQRVGGHNSTVALIMMIGTFLGSLAFGPLGARLGYGVPLVGTGVLVALLSIPLRQAGRGQKTP